MRVLALIYLVSGCAAAFVGYAQSQPLMLAIGGVAAIIAFGLFFRVRICGYLMAAFFAGLIAIILLAGVLGKELGVGTLVRCLIFAGLGYWCFSWAWNLGVEQAAAEPKLPPLRKATPVVVDAELQRAIKALPASAEPRDSIFGGKWAWVWMVALVSFIPFGLAVWFFVGRDTKPSEKTASATAKPAPTAKQEVRPSAPSTPPKAAPATNAAPKVQAATKSPTPLPAPAQRPITPPALPTASAKAPAALPWSIPNLKPASVEVRNMKLVPLVVGTNRLDWAVVPDFFRERKAQIMALTVAAGVETGEAEFKVGTSGYVIVGCGYGYQGNPSGDWEPTRWSASDFEARGWSPIPPSAVGGTLTMVDVNRVMTLFWKRVTAGETGRIRCNKYYPPFFIVLSDG